jgi:hypothetical protein
MSSNSLNAEAAGGANVIAGLVAPIWGGDVRVVIETSGVEIA